jgi:hypothetical protein
MCAINILRLRLLTLKGESFQAKPKGSIKKLTDMIILYIRYMIYWEIDNHVMEFWSHAGLSVINFLVLVCAHLISVKILIIFFTRFRNCYLNIFIALIHNRFHFQIFKMVTPTNSSGSHIGGLVVTIFIIMYHLSHARFFDEKKSKYL